MIERILEGKIHYLSGVLNLSSDVGNKLDDCVYFVRLLFSPSHTTIASEMSFIAQDLTPSTPPRGKDF